MKKSVLLMAIACAGLLASSCSDKKTQKEIELSSHRDSLSYSIGMHLSQHLPHMVREEMNIDPAFIDLFVQGVRDAYPLNITPASKAYAYGLSLGASAMEQLEEAGKMLGENDKNGSGSLDAHYFLEGLIAAVYENNSIMDAATAKNYYNRVRYLDKSDDFMRKNAKRSNVTTRPSGLQYKVEKMGEGAVATSRDIVSCKYKGTFVTGKVFDSSRDEAVTIRVDEAILGLAEAFTLLPEGTVCTVYVPWNLGYGADKVGNIPPYSTLVFELEILKVIKQ